jgi:hypothetical protein
MVFGKMNDMVIKRTNGSGGYGMLIGNSATDEQINDFKKQLPKILEILLPNLLLIYHHRLVLSIMNFRREE